MDMMIMEDWPIILDVEASGFGSGSYPIEIGLILPNEETHCMLVRPEPDWNHWDTEAANLHGISRELLEKNGRMVVDVADYLNELLHGQVVYSDGWGNDMAWIALLYDCAGKMQHFKIEHLRLLITDSQAELWESIRKEVVRDLAVERHRASIDARVLQTTYKRTRILQSG